MVINETCTLPSVVTTGKAQRFIQDTDAPLHDESVIAVRGESIAWVMRRCQTKMVACPAT